MFNYIPSPLRLSIMVWGEIETQLVSISTPSGDDTVGGDERAKPKVPLDEEWVALARKMLKGADPEERLTWRTPEVCEGEGSSSTLVTFRILYRAAIPLGA